MADVELNVHTVSECEIGKWVFLDNMYFRGVSVICCREGVFAFKIDGEEIVIGSGEYIFVYPGHFVSIEGLSECNRMAYVMLTGRDAEGYINGFGFFDMFKCKADPQYGSFLEFKRLVERGASDVEVMSFLGDLLTTIREAICSRGMEAVLFRVTGRIHGMLEEGRVRLGDLCREFRVSRSHLYEVFARNGVGCLGEFVRRQQMRRALWMLRHTDLPVREVAERSGYGSQTYFAASFRRRMGMTPGEYRRGGARSAGDESPAAR